MRSTKLAACVKNWKSLAWNRPFLERFSTTSLPKHYFILFGHQGCHQAMLVRDMVLETWVLKPLPSFAFHHSHTSVCHGFVYTGTSAGCVRGTVFNMHTKVFRRLPQLNFPPGGYSTMSKLAVDKRSSGNAFKVLVVCDQGLTSVYDSSVGEWTRKSVPLVHVFQKEDSTYCEGVMYIKNGRFKIRPDFPRDPDYENVSTVIAYNFEHDQWSILPMVEKGPARMQGLGEWRGAQLRDLSLDRKAGLRVWEFQQLVQEWLEVDRMPDDMLAWFLDDDNTGRTCFAFTLRFCSEDPDVLL
jgi:hypothetical protein